MTETRAGRRASLAASAYRVVLLAAFAVGAALPATAAASPPLKLSYRVTHSSYGNIGTYTNTIVPTSDGTTVKTQVQLQVRMLGIRVYDQEARRIEEWRGKRLVSFSGVTVKNGDKPVIVQGVANGNKFIIKAPSGTINAPADVRPANPWSARFLGSDTLMRPDNGKLEHVRISAGQPTAVKLDGQQVLAREYDITGQARSEVWLDARGIPVKFVVHDDSGAVTFTLTKCGDCRLALSYLSLSPNSQR